jgi:hypothetical protein
MPGKGLPKPGGMTAGSKPYRVLMGPVKVGGWRVTYLEDLHGRQFCYRVKGWHVEKIELYRAAPGVRYDELSVAGPAPHVGQPSRMPGWSLDEMGVRHLSQQSPAVRGRADRRPGRHGGVR